MWLDHIALQLREGLNDVRGELEAGELEIAARQEPPLAGLRLSELIDLARQPSRTQEKQDPVLLAVVHCYRTREKRLWAPVLLAMLAPSLLARAYRFVLATPAEDPVEILQQLVMETLVVAATIPLDETSHWIRRRIIREAARRVRRWLEWMAQQQRVASLDELAEERELVLTPEDDEARWEVSELMSSGAVPADVELVSGPAVAGETLEEMAARLGISMEAMKSRLRRARQRLQALLAA